MKKPGILIFSILVSILFFVLLSKVFMGVSEYLAHKYKPEYITPTSKDSSYMTLLKDTLKRKPAMDLSNELRQFYILSDSIQTILNAEISPDLISGIILDKGMAQEYHSELKRFDDTGIIACPSGCLDSSYLQLENWDEFIRQSSPSEIGDFIEKKISEIEEAELAQLKLME